MNILKLGLGLIDKIFPDPIKNKEAKAQLLEAESKGQLEQLKTQASVIIAESKGESWLQRNWRPITMLTFTGLVVAHWLGYTPENLSEAESLKLLSLVEIGISGYILGRSVEKTVPKAVQLVEAMKKDKV